MEIDSIDKTGRAAGLKFLTAAATAQLAVLSDFYLKTSFSRPFMVLIEPTLRCPMACKFCSLPTDSTYPKTAELSLSSWQRILHELSSFSALTREIFISGGEPFLRPDMCDILEYAHCLGIRTRMITIGAFCTPAVCDRLLNSPVNWLKFSLHSAEPEVHNALVGRPVFSKAIAAIRYLRESEYAGKLGILTTIYQGNVDRLEMIVELAQELGVDSVFFRPLFGNTDAIRTFGTPALQNPECVIKNPEDLLKAVEQLKHLKRQGAPIANTPQQLDLLVRQANGENQGVKGCHMMYESIYIRPNGDVEVCGHMSLGIMGNVAHTSLVDVLNSEAAYKARHAISRHCRCQGNAFVRKSFSEKTALLLQLLTER